jgi:hypothetical protein
MTTNLPVVDPLKVHAPVMVVPEEHNGIATEEDFLDIFRQLPNPDRQFIVLPGAAQSTTGTSFGTPCTPPAASPLRTMTVGISSAVGMATVGSTLRRRAISTASRLNGHLG